MRRTLIVVVGVIAALVVADRAYAIASGGRGILEQAIFHLKNQSGAVDRTAYSKLADWISVKDYGALGDGLNDDTNAITNAVAAAGATQLLNFPCPGTYITSTYGTLACGVYYPPLAATGATLRAVATKLLDTVSVKDFGAKGDGVADDTTAIQNALNAGSHKVYVPGGTYLVSAKLTVPLSVGIVGDGYLSSIIKKNYNGDLLDYSAGANFTQNLSFDGNAPTFTGRTIVITGGAAQWFDAMEIKCLGSAGNYCVEYTANCAGTQSWITNSTVKTSTSLNVAIKYPSAVENGCPRSIINTQGNGSILIDFGNSNDSFFVGNFTNGFVFNANTSLAYIAHNRVATVGVTTTVSGQALQFHGNAFAGDVILDATTTDVLFSSYISGGTGTVTDNGVRNTVIMPGSLGGTLKINSGFAQNGAGFKHSRSTAGCATAAAAGARCTTTVTWTTAFPDANYAVICIGSGINSGFPIAGGTDNAIAASVQFYTVAATAAAAQWAVIECIAVHQ